MRGAFARPNCTGGATFAAVRKKRRVKTKDLGRCTSVRPRSIVRNRHAALFAVVLLRLLVVGVLVLHILVEVAGGAEVFLDRALALFEPVAEVGILRVARALFPDVEHLFMLMHGHAEVAAIELAILAVF